MTTSRREFLKNSTLAAAAISFFPAYASSKPLKDMLIGLQLYSIRDAMKTDPMKSLQRLAEMGYTHVEHANYSERKFYGWNASEFKKILADLGMKMPSGHTVLHADHWDEGQKDFTDQWKYTIEDAATMGQDYVISPWLDEKIWSDYDKLLAFMEVYNKSGQLCKKSGMKFGYHNHDFEFSKKVNGKVLYDIILQNTDPDLVIQQLDFGNMVNGKATAGPWLNKYPGRFPSVHVKDMTEGTGDHGKYDSTILGEGIVGVQDVLRKCKDIGGTTQFIIEQESYQGKTPMECMEEDLKIMAKWGFGS